MRHLAALLVASMALIAAATPVGAGGVIGRPGQIATGYLELTEYEVADLVDERIAAGDLDADQVHKTSTGDHPVRHTCRSTHRRRRDPRVLR